MEQKDVDRRLAEAGIKKHSRSWQDYETAKRVLVGDEVLSDVEYNKIMFRIVNYVGV